MYCSREAAFASSSPPDLHPLALVGRGRTGQGVTDSVQRGCKPLN
jgi:hypothetical protein